MQRFMTRGRCHSGVLVAIVLAVAGEARAQTYTAFSVFKQMTTADLATCQLKLTRAFDSCSLPPPTYLFATSKSGADLHAFDPFHRRSVFPYISDYVEIVGTSPDAFATPIVTVLTASEFQAAIAAVSPLSDVVDGGVDSSAELSFSLLQKSGGKTRCFESLLDAADATLLLSALKQALLADAPVYDVLAEVACNNRWLGSANAALVPSSEVQVTVSELRRKGDVGDWTFDGTVTVTNVSHRTLSPPLILVLASKDWNVTLRGASGHTCRIRPVGSPYFALPVGSGLARNASITLPLVFDDAASDKIELNYVAPGNLAISPRVFQGTGER
jgi:hypothetical protein